MTVYYISTTDEFRDVIQRHKTVVLNCYAAGDDSCKMMDPILEKHTYTYGDFYFIKFDVDVVPDLTQELGVTTLPTYILFKGGEKVETLEGADAPALVDLITKGIE